MNINGGVNQSDRDKGFDPTDLPRGERQKITTDLYRKRWEDIFGNKKDQSSTDPEYKQNNT